MLNPKDLDTITEDIDPDVLAELSDGREEGEEDDPNQQ